MGDAEATSLSAALASLGAEHGVRLTELTDALGRPLDSAVEALDVFTAWMEHGDTGDASGFDSDLQLWCTAVPLVHSIAGHTAPTEAEAEAASIFDILAEDD